MSAPALVATCWTSAGNVAPLDDPEASPFTAIDRVQAVASPSGWWREDDVSWRATWELLLEAARELGASFIKVGTEVGSPVDVVGFIRAMREVGFNGPWGVEILSMEHRQRPLIEALTVARETTLAAFQQADHEQESEREPACASD